MKIVYVAKHGEHDNCDESAIAWALQQLGHEVVCVEERPMDPVDWKNLKADFLLFHKWCHPAALDCLTIPAVKWDWDLVESHDPTIAHLDHRRVKSVLPVEPYCLVCCYSDGDWVAKDTTGKRVQLMQGADERYAGYGTPYAGVAPILFTGRLNYHGAGRVQQIRALQERYGNRFQIVGEPPSTKVHGRRLADLFASTKVVVAPVTPSTNHYWSNRVYLTLGLGGYLIHPYCSDLVEQYPEDTLLMYRNQKELYELIDKSLVNPSTMEFFRENSHRHTMNNHTYRHRCSDLINIVKERL